jgi:adenine-specific DNA-methyltransferase
MAQSSAHPADAPAGFEIQTSAPTIQMEMAAPPESGILIEFPGKLAVRSILGKLRPRVQRRLPQLCYGEDEDQARNLVVEGDNLQVMASLYRYRGQIDLVLADPPYNTGKDFRYNDRWDVDPNDPNPGDIVTTEDGGRHSKWMRFMAPRLEMMKAMLKPGGVCAVCVDERELFRLGMMMDEVFREINRIAIINWQKTYSAKNDSGHGWPVEVALGSAYGAC